MIIVITYDVSVVDADGRRRLRKISNTCLDYGIRVQNSVFECEITPVQWVQLKSKLLHLFDQQKDSLRFYNLGANGKKRIEHHGIKFYPDTIRDPIIL